MKKWILKAVVQKTISYLPYSYRINYFFQKYITKGVALSNEYFYDRLGHARVHLESYQKYSGQAFPLSSLEIGTGWYPIVPVSFFLAGTENIYSTDITFHTSKEKIITTLLKMQESFRSGKLQQQISVNPERYSILENILSDHTQLSAEEILKRLHITYLIEDARQSSLPDDSIDLINSNNTFEHIYPEILKPILREFKRIVNKKNGVMSHFIDLSDHFAHLDRSITIYNFLQFSERQWKLIDNSIQPQSRLRIDDYRSLYKELNIPINEETFRKGDTTQLFTVPLDKRFADKPADINAISHCHFVSVFN